jgi:hypothetical protein
MEFRTGTLGIHSPTRQGPCVCFPKLKRVKGLLCARCSPGVCRGPTAARRPRTSRRGRDPTPAARGGTSEGRRVCLMTPRSAGRCLAHRAAGVLALARLSRQPPCLRLLPSVLEDDSSSLHPTQVVLRWQPPQGIFSFFACMLCALSAGEAARSHAQR